MRCGLLLVGLLLAATPALAGFSDADAAAIAAQSPAVTKSLTTIRAAIKKLPGDLRGKTQDALLGPGTCIAYRANETEQSRQAVVDELVRQGFAANATDAARSLYGYPVKADGRCVHVAAPFLATPGSEEGSHHAWPGGLADHVAFNLHAADDLVTRYRAVTQESKALDAATLDAAVLWHDWAKRLVLHWGDEGVVSYETQIAGTLSHHVIGLAEAMARGLPAREILIQVCAHAAPANDSDAKVTGWLRAAAIIAHADPVALGVLKPAAGGGFTLTVTPECRIHNLSDGNWVVGVPAMRHAQAVLAKLVPQLGYQPGEARTRRFILTALATYGAERFDMVDEAEALKLLRDLNAKLSPRDD